MRTLLALTLGVLLLSSSCELLDDGTSGTDIAEGLKTALEVGTDSSVFKTSATDGFYKDAALKIFLPSEANVIVSNINKIPYGTQMLESVYLRINRAAEDAAKSAGPIFKSSIKEMSISDALSILNGNNPADTRKSASFDSTAATQYLKSTCYAQLVEAFSVPINQSLDKDLVGGVSTNEAWGELTSAYNSVAFILGQSKVNTNLGAYATERALNGLFLKVGEEEKKIRRDPWKWIATTVGDILTKVFGSRS